jgi:hypothetical protein
MMSLLSIDNPPVKGANAVPDLDPQKIGADEGEKAQSITESRSSCYPVRKLPLTRAICARKLRDLSKGTSPVKWNSQFFATRQTGGNNMLRCGLGKRNHARTRAVRPGAARRSDRPFHPRVENLEGRALPSVSVFTFYGPLVGVITETSFKAPLAIEIEVITIELNVPSLAAPSAVPSVTVISSEPVVVTPTSVSAPQSSVHPATTLNTPVTSTVPAVLTAPASTISTDAGASLRGSTTGTGSEPVSLGFTGVTTPGRPVIFRPTSPDTTPVSGFIGLSDQVVPVNPVLFSRVPTVLTPDPRVQPTGPIVLPAQPLSNRMEFIGGGTTIADNPLQDQVEAPEAVLPLPRPAEPPADDMGEMAPLGGMLDLPLEEAALSRESILPEAMVLGTLAGQESESQDILSPGLVAELALAVCLGNFRIGSPAEVAAHRGSKEREMEIASRKK